MKLSVILFAIYANNTTICLDTSNFYSVEVQIVELQAMANSLKLTLARLGLELTPEKKPSSQQYMTISHAHTKEFKSTLSITMVELHNNHAASQKAVVTMAKAVTVRALTCSLTTHDLNKTHARAIQVLHCVTLHNLSLTHTRTHKQPKWQLENEENVHIAESTSSKVQVQLLLLKILCTVTKRHEMTTLVPLLSS